MKRGKDIECVDRMRFERRVKITERLLGDIFTVEHREHR